MTYISTSSSLNMMSDANFHLLLLEMCIPHLGFRTYQGQTSGLAWLNKSSLRVTASIDLVVVKKTQLYFQI